MSEYQPSTSDANTAVTLLLGALAFLLIIGFAMVVLNIVARWRIYTKMGKPGWSALVPFYSDYVLMQGVAPQNKVLTWAYVLIGPVIGIVSYLGGATGSSDAFGASTATGFEASVQTTEGPLGILTTLLAIAYFVINILVMLRLSKAFGHSGGFTVGLVLVQLIFMLILAFGKSEYRGPDGEGSANDAGNYLPPQNPQGNPPTPFA